VIAPLIGAHNGFNLELPWKIAIVTYSLELRNLMTNRYGLSFDEITEKLNNALVVYDPFLHELLNILIEEAKSQPLKYIDVDGIEREFEIDGLPCVFARNPVLIHGGIQALSINKIKSNVADETIGMSSLIALAPNADYDGDEMNGISVKERDMMCHFLSIAPWEMMYSKQVPMMSNMVFITKPDRITVNNWLKEVPDENHLTIIK
jgi:hypothetical protein